MGVSGPKFNTQHVIHTGCVTTVPLLDDKLTWQRCCCHVCCHHWDQCHTFCPSPWAGKTQWWHTGHAWMPFYCDTLSLFKISVKQCSQWRRLLHPCSSWEQELLLEDFGFISVRLNQRASTSWVSQIVFLPVWVLLLAEGVDGKRGEGSGDAHVVAEVPQKVKGLHMDYKEGKAPAALPWAPAVRSTKDKGLWRMERGWVAGKFQSQEGGGESNNDGWQQ